MHEHFPKTNENERAVAKEIHTRMILKIQFLILILQQRIMSGQNSGIEGSVRKSNSSSGKYLEVLNEDKYEKMTASLSYLPLSACCGVGESVRGFLGEETTRKISYDSNMKSFPSIN